MTKRQEVKHINGKDQLSLVVTHEDFKDPHNGALQELHAVKKHFIVVEEGDAEVIDQEVKGQNHGGTTELIAALTGVVDIDDDNQPAPENVPEQGQVTDSVLSDEWGHHGFCFRQQANLPNIGAKLAYPINTTTNDINLQLFEILFPKAFMESVMIPEMNKKLKDPKLTYGEFLRWI